MNLSLKYRPKNLNDIIAQERLLGENGILKRLIEMQKLSHTFLWGKSGCGKTSLARVIASTLRMDFYEFNATSLKIEEIRKVIHDYTNRLTKPLIFIDEFHRLSKNQQEVLLPFMESHLALIIGATTKNPYQSLLPSIRSRSHCFELNPIDELSMRNYIDNILIKENIKADEECRDYLIHSSGGDVRGVLNLLQTALDLNNPLQIEELKTIRPTPLIQGVANNAEHHELISAMIKSIRGSDVDASLYYLARLIEGGEDALYIARRLSILASEDIGNANPNALNLSSSALNITKEIGFPEAKIVLSQLVIYLSCSPKSNSAYEAINKATDEIQKGAIFEIPTHLKHHSPKYLYPHDNGGWVEQAYLSENLKFYHPKLIGFEKTLDEWLGKIKKS
ncbi:MAG: recombinase RarA [Sulfurovum sp. AS07-7]|nr:MAG: recombinase RarA [Sulfurovum sp. AS07-7]